MGTWSGSREEAIEYLQWWAYPERDDDRFPITVEHVAAREVLAELARLQEIASVLDQFNDEVRRLQGIEVRARERLHATSNHEVWSALVDILGDQ